jgi:hypothetical protein
MVGSTRKSLAALHYGLLFLTLFGYVYLGVYRAMPFNLLSPENFRHERGAVRGSFLKVYNYAEDVHRDPARSVWDLGDHLVYRGHNPGMFLFSTVVLYELGLDEPSKILPVPLAMNTLTLLLLYLLFRGLFRQRWIGLFTALYAAFCAAFLTQATALGAGSYGKLFQLAAGLAFLHYLRNGRRPLLAATVIFYFLACWNYWEWYVSTALLLLGVHYAERGRVFSRDLRAVACAPLAAFGSFLALMAANQGGLGAALRWLYSVVMFRTLDRPQPAGYFDNSPAGKYLDLESLGGYLEQIGSRIDGWYHLPPAAFALMLAVVLFVHPKSRENAYRVFFFLLPAAFYWNLVMVQHTIIHYYTALHYYIALTPIFGCFVVEAAEYAYRKLEGRPFRRLVAGLVVFPVVYTVAAGMASDILGTQAKYRERYLEHQRKGGDGKAAVPLNRVPGPAKASRGERPASRPRTPAPSR